MALAQSGPTVTPGSVTLSGPIRSSAGGHASFHAAAQDPNGTAMYQFWVQEPNGQWTDAQNYSTSPNFTLSTPSAGNYLVAVDVMDQSQVAAGDWSAAQTTLPDGVFVQSAVTVSASATDATAGTPITLTAAAHSIFDPLYQFWWEQQGHWHQSGPYQSGSTFTFTPPTSGAVTYVAYAKSPAAANNPHGALMSPAGTATEYGLASQVSVAVAGPTVVADGMASDTVTVTVQDSLHDTVANFSGKVDLIPSSPVVDFPGEGTAAVTVSGGVGTLAFTVAPGHGGQSYSIVSDHLLSAASSAGGTPGQGQVANVSYGSATVSALVPQAASLTVTPMLPSLANNAANSDTVWVGLSDQAANPETTRVGRYVTLTLTGPGSFSASGTQATESEYVPAGTTQVSTQVYDVQAGSGSIVVTAAASGLAGASATIGIDQVGSANHLAIASSQVFFGGHTYTKYQLEVVDAAGNLVTTGSGAHATFSLADNARKSQLAYYPDSTETTTGLNLGTEYDSSNISAQSFSTTSGVATVYVATEYTHTATNPTITATDTTTGFTATAAYNFAAPISGYAVLAPAWMKTMHRETTHTSPQYDERHPHGFSVLAGQRATVSAQLTNQFGTPVAEANQPIWFELLQPTTGTGMLPNGASQSGDVYEAFTNAQGIATMQVSTPSGAPANRHDHFHIRVFGQADLGKTFGQLDNARPVRRAWKTDSYTVVPASSYATSFKLNYSELDVDNGSGNDIPWAGTGNLPAGAKVSGLELQALNALGAPVVANHYWNNGGDGLVVTSSNSGVASFHANGFDVRSFGVANQWFVSDEWESSDGRPRALNLNHLQLGHAGTATITIQDISNPSMPTLSFTVTVVPGSATDDPMVELNGAPISRSNPLTLNANQSQQLSVVNVDAGGDPIPNATGHPLTVTLPTPPTGFVWRTTASGPTSPGSVAVTIPVNASSAPVWLVGTVSGATTHRRIRGSD